MIDIFFIVLKQCYTFLTPIVRSHDLGLYQSFLHKRWIFQKPVLAEENSL